MWTSLPSEPIYSKFVTQRDIMSYKYLQLITISVASWKLRRNCRREGVGRSTTSGSPMTSTFTAAATSGYFSAASMSSAAATERARRRRRQELNVTVMLVVISTTLVLCQTAEPFIHPAVYTARYGPCSVYQPSYNARRVTANIFEMFSYSVNFVFYCAFQKQFNAAVRALFRRPLVWAQRRLGCRRGAVGGSTETGIIDNVTAIAYSVHVG